MNIQDDMQTLLQKEMDRKDFLKHVGIGFAAIVGITTVLKTVTSLSGNGQKQSVGYSSGVYGGGQSSKGSLGPKQS
ncbi:MAG TPA: hypothetical protein VK502_01755 [Candidatus Saccharimonadales bacterium]|nr:hypothetical protein [Candidatus Saccharimonadales bacterium]